MPFEYSPPKKITIIVSLALEVLGIVMASIGAFDRAVPFLEQVLGQAPAWNVDLVMIITGVALTGVAWFVIFLGVKLRGV